MANSKTTLFFLTMYFILSGSVLNAQNLDSITLKWLADIDSKCSENVMTMQKDNQGKDYLYVASKEGGLKIYDIQNPTNPKFIDQIVGSVIKNYSVMNVNQNGTYLYLTLGDFFSNKEAPAMAILDISDINNAIVTDIWEYGTATEGAGMIVTNGDYAYMAAMAHGLIILNIKDKSDIKFESRLVPDLDFPQKNADLTKINARGLQYRNGIIYLSYDAGGVRIIDVQDPKKPMERGGYSNPLLNGRPRAYNNVVLDGKYLYVTFDYCGMEVLDVSDSSKIELVSWWNPWNCPNNNWFTSRGHTNEIDIDTNCNLLFMSTGKSEMYVLDISDPNNPDSLSSYGDIDNKKGTWGISSHGGQVFMSYICTLGIPFQSNWSGVKILSYSDSCSKTGKTSNINKNNFSIYPNPISESFQISPNNYQEMKLFNSQGELIKIFSKKFNNYKLEDVSSGLYYLSIKTDKGLIRKTIIKQ